VNTTIPGRPPVERPPSQPPDGRPAPHPGPVQGREVRELAELLAQVVQMARHTAIFPGHWEQIAEQATEYPSVRAALLAAEVDS
jgi:hypothetical protein